ncbi:MAG: glycerate dehydrogenase, partial [Gammaproteobacteria bacterium]|nr:glycerate dehydrogenase [Gammaproteobacteria bacterium]
MDSLRPQELSLKNLEQQGTEWKFYSMTTADQIAERLKNAEIVVSNKVILGKNELSIARKLKLICVAATGTNNVDLEAAKERGIAVCNVRGYATASVTQHVFGLMISLASNLAAYREAVKKGEWSKSHQFCLLNYPIIELQGKKLGIVGNGVLGKAVSKLASDFGMELLIAESLRLDAPEDKQRVPLDVVFREADFLSLHCPLSEQTQGLINKKNLKKMKPTSFLINTSRGGLIVEEDLVWALETGQIQGAALD